MGELLHSARQPLGVLASFGDHSPGSDSDDHRAQYNDGLQERAANVVDRPNPIVIGEVSTCWDKPCRQPKDGHQTDADEEGHAEHEPEAADAAALEEGQISEPVPLPREAGAGRASKTPLSFTANHPQPNQQHPAARPTMTAIGKAICIRASLL
jgi:hypothetical protein